MPPGDSGTSGATQVTLRRAIPFQLAVRLPYTPQGVLRQKKEIRMRLAKLPLTLAAVFISTALAATPPITLEVDARDVAHGIQHAHLSIPAHAGTMTLAYPKWIPGEHAANGPITQVVSLLIKAGEQMLPWRRDPLDPYRLRV